MALALGPQCCCCPTKTQSGLPDELTIAFTKLTSSGTGMPSDGSPGPCGEIENWSFDDYFVDLLTSISFDYVGGENATPTPGCGGCCFQYEAQKSYTWDADNSNGCNSVFDEPAILFGDAPFDESILGGDLVHYKAEGEPIDCEPGAAPGGCCDDCPDCEALAASEMLQQVGGTLRSYTPIVGDANISICIDEEVVTMCGVISQYMGILERVGEYTYTSGGRTLPGVDCYEVDAEIVDESTLTCVTVEIVRIEFTATADLSAVSGASIWEKIKNYTEWEIDYSYAVCGAGEGCSGAAYHCYGRCAMSQVTCQIFHDCGELEQTKLPNDPVDQECLYSTGTLGLTFTD